MTRDEVLRLIYAARTAETRPDLRGADLRETDLHEENLREADLREANLRDANLPWADLRGARLRGADLREANLRGADLRDADLRGADLSYVDLRWADLGGAPYCLTLSGLPSGHANLYPTPNGWQSTVGCWQGTVDALAAMTATNENWPEATGAECARRRPSLEAWIALCRDHITRHPEVVPNLAAKWSTEGMIQ